MSDVKSKEVANAIQKRKEFVEFEAKKAEMREKIKSQKLKLKLEPHAARFIDSKRWVASNYVKGGDKNVVRVYIDLRQFKEIVGIETKYQNQTVRYKNKPGYWVRCRDIHHYINGVNIPLDVFKEILAVADGAYICLRTNTLYTNSSMLIRAFKKINAGRK